MLSNSNFTISLQSIQNELSQLENQLLRFKIVIGQSSLLHTSTQSEMNLQFSSQISQIEASFIKFCTKYEEQIRNIQSRLNFVLQINTRNSERKDLSADQKYLIVTQKIDMLEKSLKRTQQNESKLIDAINILMTKYQIQDQPTMIQNDQYLRNRIKTSRSSSMITFQPCGGVARQLNINRSENSRQNLTKTMKKQQNSIYLFKDDHSQSMTPNHQQQNLKNFSKPGYAPKVSLKQASGANKQLKFLNTNIKVSNNSHDLKNYRASSLNSHDHRLKFMMDNLNY